MKFAVAAFALPFLAGSVAAGSGPMIVPIANPRDVAFDLKGIAHVTAGNLVHRVDPATGATRVSGGQPGTQFMGAAARIDGCAIAFAETTSTQSTIHVYRLDHGYTIQWIVDPQQQGTYSVAWQGNSVIASPAGNSWGSLIKFDPPTGRRRQLDRVRTPAILASSDHGTLIVAESGISSGPLSLLSSQDVMLDTLNTDWFLFEASISPDGAIAAVPSYTGTFIFDLDGGELAARPGRLGVYADHGPLSVTYARHTQAAFAATWSFGTSPGSKVLVYPDRTMTSPIEIDSIDLDWVGNGSYAAGVTALSVDGRWLAVTTPTAVRFYDVSKYASHPTRLFATGFDECYL